MSSSGLNWCDQFSIQPKYPSRLRYASHPPEVGEFVQPGYQVKRPNPGGKVFYWYYYPYHTQNLEPLRGHGYGWDTYHYTGRIPRR